MPQCGGGPAVSAGGRCRTPTSLADPWPAAGSPRRCGRTACLPAWLPLQRRADAESRAANGPRDDPVMGLADDRRATRHGGRASCPGLVPRGCLRLGASGADRTRSPTHRHPALDAQLERKHAAAPAADAALYGSIRDPEHLPVYQPCGRVASGVLGDADLTLCNLTAAAQLAPVGGLCARMFPACGAPPCPLSRATPTLLCGRMVLAPRAAGATGAAPLRVVPR